jgi:hypothetical protein
MTAANTNINDSHRSAEKEDLFLKYDSRNIIKLAKACRGYDTIKK